MPHCGQWCDPMGIILFFAQIIRQDGFAPLPSGTCVSLIVTLFVDFYNIHHTFYIHKTLNVIYLKVFHVISKVMTPKIIILKMQKCKKKREAIFFSANSNIPLRIYLVKVIPLLKKVHTFGCFPMSENWLLCRMCVYMYFLFEMCDSVYLLQSYNWKTWEIKSLCLYHHQPLVRKYMKFECLSSYFPFFKINCKRKKYVSSIIKEKVT